MTDRFQVDVWESCRENIWLAYCEDFPDIVGRGFDQDEAIEDIITKVYERILH